MNDLGPTATYPSEAAKHLALVMPYLQGNIIDLGSGGWPVLKHAIQVELPKEDYAHYTQNRPEDFPIQWRGNATDLPFKDGVVDTVFSSHLLEDFVHSDWQPILKEWSRILKAGGKLVVLTPDKKLWGEAILRGQPPNCSHKHEPAFGDVSQAGLAIGLNLVIERYAAEPPDYSVLTVFEK